MIRKLFVLLVFAAIGYLVYQNIPEMRRYLRIKKM